MRNALEWFNQTEAYHKAVALAKKFDIKHYTTNCPTKLDKYGHDYGYLIGDFVVKLDRQEFFMTLHCRVYYNTTRKRFECHMETAITLKLESISGTFYSMSNKLDFSDPFVINFVIPVEQGWTVLEKWANEHVVFKISGDTVKYRLLDRNGVVTKEEEMDWDGTHQTTFKLKKESKFSRIVKSVIMRKLILFFSILLISSCTIQDHVTAWKTCNTTVEQAKKKRRSKKSYRKAYKKFLKHIDPCLKDK